MGRLIFAILFISILPVYGQNSSLIIAQGDTLELHKKLNDSLDIAQTYQAKGYLEFHIDSVIRSNETSYFYAYVGQKYKWGNVVVKGESFLMEMPLKNFESGNAINLTQLNSDAEKVINYFENNGYPFVQLNFENLTLREERIEGEILVYRGPYISLDSLELLNKEGVNPNLVQNVLGVKLHSAYDESAMVDLVDKIKQSPYFESISPPEIIFNDSSAILVLNLKSSKNSYIDGILGFQNNNQTQKFEVIGDINLVLKNTFNIGDQINLIWNSSANNTQAFNLSVALPYLFKSNLGVEGNIDIFNQDTLFTNINLEGAITYSLTANTKVGATFKKVSSRGSNSADNITPTETNYFGLKLNSQQINNYKNPSKGYVLLTSGLIGEKEVESEDLALPQYEVQNWLKVFVPLYGRFSAALTNKTAWILSDHIFYNEQFRIGGYNSIRGIDQQSLYCTGYSISTAEMRFNYEENSNIHVFTDWAWYESNLQDVYYKDWLYSVGIGITLYTNAGLFSMDYATATTLNDRLSLGDANITFGYTTYF